MPRTVLTCHVVLLLLLSALAGSGVGLILGDRTQPGLTGSTAQCMAWVAAGLALVLVVTELKGVRWPAVVAFCAAVVGLVAVRGKDTVPLVSIWTWALAWAAVVTWFAVLTAKARQNR